MSSFTTPNQIAYAKRMAAVCDYIYDNLDEDLSLDHVSNVAHFSKYHFHRQFAIFTGLSLHKFVQQARLKHASYQLVFYPKKSVLEIAFDARFESGEAFSRAFKKYFDRTPSEFRKHPNWKPWHETYQSPKEMSMSDVKDVKIIDFPTTRVGVFEHKGDPGLVNQSAATFIEWRQATGLSTQAQKRTFGIPYQDPNEVEPEQFEFDICGEVSHPIADNPQGVIEKTLPGGRCAVLRHYGSHEALATTVYKLYRDWLPESGEHLRDFPCFFEYHNFLPDVNECDLVTDVFLPIM